MIYYRCPDKATPTGGVKRIYQHVTHLNRNGINACVLHGRFGFRAKWFANDAHVAYLQGPNRKWLTRLQFLERRCGSPYSRWSAIYKGKTVYFSDHDKTRKKTLINADDIIVVPEVYGRNIHEIDSQLDVVVLALSITNLLKGYSVADRPSSIHFKKPNIVAVVANSQYVRNSVLELNPSCPVSRIRTGIDTNIFQYVENKKKQIAFMPRKNLRDLKHVLMAIGDIQKKAGWNVCAIDGLSETRVAEILKESSIFASTGYQEGFSRPAAEAGACGCLVVGYHGMGGREYMHPEFSFPVEAGDVLGFAETLRAVMEMIDTKPEEAIARRKAMSDYIRTNFSLEHEEQDLVQFWTNLKKNQKNTGKGEVLRST